MNVLNFYWTNFDKKEENKNGKKHTSKHNLSLLIVKKK
jgi:hypothetical protein